MSENEHTSRIMTVARILDSGAPGGQTEAVFLESAMFFRISPENPASDQIITALQDALENGSQVEVRLKSLDSDIIEDVRTIDQDPE